MNVYKFYNPSLFGYQDFPIQGSLFNELLDLCSQYCCTLSLQFYSRDVRLYEAFLNYRIPKPKEIPFTGKGDEGDFYDECSESGSTPEIMYFRVCSKILRLMHMVSDNLFEWCAPVDYFGHNNPENPTFYREDGSVFFTAITHEEECSLMPRCYENVSHILNSAPWVIAGELHQNGTFAKWDFSKELILKYKEFGLVQEHKHTQGDGSSV